MGFQEFLAGTFHPPFFQRCEKCGPGSKSVKPWNTIRTSSPYSFSTTSTSTSSCMTLAAPYATLAIIAVDFWERDISRPMAPTLHSLSTRRNEEIFLKSFLGHQSATNRQFDVRKEAFVGIMYHRWCLMYVYFAVYLPAHAQYAFFRPFWWAKKHHYAAR